MSRHSTRGTVGYMPLSYYMEQISKQCEFENPDTIRNVQEQAILDYGPSHPLFESDVPRRRPQNDDRLTLQYTGSRSEKTPYLEDGTFLDHVFLRKDPHGSDPQAAMRLHRRYQMDRKDTMKKYTDAEPSLPESGKSQSMVMRSVKGTYDFIKDRLKIFDTSLTSNKSGAGKLYAKNKSKLCDTVSDERKRPLYDSLCAENQRKVTKISNETHIGWRSTVDHRFKIAQYSRLRKSMSSNKVNHFKNRGNSKLTHDIKRNQTAKVGKSLVLKMSDFIKQKDSNMKSSDVEFKSSETGIQKKRKSKLSKSELISLFEGTQSSQDDAAHTLLKGLGNQHVGGKQGKVDYSFIGKYAMDNDIYDQIMMVNSKMGPQYFKDLRDEIIQTSEKHDLDFTIANKKNKKTEDSSKASWKSEVDVDGESKNIANYKKRTKKSRDERGMTNHEDYHRKTLENMTSRRSRTNNPVGVRNSARDNVVTDELSSSWKHGASNLQKSREGRTNGMFQHNDEKHLIDQTSSRA
jgi:hypothetical protein